jgi:hypothetical protein
MQFSAKLLRDGKIVLNAVSGTLVNRGIPGGSEDWHGSFGAPQTASIDAGETYRLVLDDGRSADIMIDTTHQETGRGMTVEFGVQGRLQ